MTFICEIIMIVRRGNAACRTKVQRTKNDDALLLALFAPLAGLSFGLVPISESARPQ